MERRDQAVDCINVASQQVHIPGNTAKPIVGLGEDHVDIISVGGNFFFDIQHLVAECFQFIGELFLTDICSANLVYFCGQAAQPVVDLGDSHVDKVGISLDLLTDCPQAVGEHFFSDGSDYFLIHVFHYDSLNHTGLDDGFSGQFFRFGQLFLHQIADQLGKYCLGFRGKQKIRAGCLQLDGHFFFDCFFDHNSQLVFDQFGQFVNGRVQLSQNIGGDPLLHAGSILKNLAFDKSFQSGQGTGKHHGCFISGHCPGPAKCTIRIPFDQADRCKLHYRVVRPVMRWYI